MGSQQFHFGRAKQAQLWLLRAAAVLGLLLTAACGGGGAAAGKTYPPYRYRLTVEVETPQGLRTGSSVIEVKLIKGGMLNISGGGAGGDAINRVRGQAVAIDLPNGQTLLRCWSHTRDGIGRKISMRCRCPIQHSGKWPRARPMANGILI